MKKITEIYGIMGKRGHGKDTLAKEVVAIDPSFTVLHFADELKRQCGVIFGLSQEELHDPAVKELPFTTPVIMDEFLDAIRTVTHVDVQSQNKVARSPRELLQYYGTDYIRAARDTYWVDMLVERIKAIGSKVLVPDTRFPNEAAAIKALGGLLVKVVRTDMNTQDHASTHASETSIDNIQANMTVDVATGDFATIKAAAKIIATNSFELEAKKSVAEKALAYIVDGFNASFACWQALSNMGANIGVRYNQENGMKEFHILDISPRNNVAPSRESILAAKDTIEQALKAGMFDKLEETNGIARKA